jgi:hypothetical protein
MSKHTWVSSTLGHGDAMCARCLITNREAAVLGQLNSCSKPEDQDNARLIAAAPDLLEALIDLAGAGAEAWGEDRPCVRIARAAIAKAEGNQ